MTNIKINEKWKCNNEYYACPYCNKQYSRMGICSHIFRSHTEEGKYNSYSPLKDNSKYVPWNKGKTKENNDSLKKFSKLLKEKYKSGIIKPYIKDKHHTIETKLKLSISMKRAHAEGRAWNIGKSRWNNEPSYPEKFFIKVINNEFDDKNYKREFNIGIYSIDFAWIDKKLALEIDGEQHQRFDEVKERDIRKDKFLIENGWKILRIQWKNVYSNPSYYINLANTFIGK